MKQDKLNWHKLQFLKSSPDLVGCPSDSTGEVAFVGRSNAGKSSCLNALANKKIARTSKTPGRTQLINYFSLENDKYIVDLPGYGYANIAKNNKNQIENMLVEYLSFRVQLSALILITDCRHPLASQDLELLALAKEEKLPVRIILSKIDKLNRSQANKVIKQLEGENTEIISSQSFSALKKVGITELNNYLHNYLI